MLDQNLTHKKLPENHSYTEKIKVFKELIL